MNKKKAVHLTRLSSYIHSNNLENFYAGKWCDPFIKKSKNYLKYTHNNKKLNFFQMKTISFLTKKLNFYHNTKFSKSFWKIVLFPWIFLFSHVLFDRYLIIRRLNKIKNVKYFLIQGSDLNRTIFDNYLQFANNYHTDFFNNNIFFDLLKIKSSDKFKFFNSRKNFKLIEQNNKKKLNYKKYISLFSNKNVIFFDTNLSLKKNYILYLKYFFYNNFQNLPKNKNLDLKFRNLDLKKNYSKNLNFQHILNYFSIKYLPKSYLENFKFYKSKKLSKDLSKKPSIVVTSNSHITDDFFKIWYGQIKEKYKKTKLFVLQKGSEYFLKTEANTDLTYDLSDKKITWGLFNTNKKKTIFAGANLNLKYNKVLNNKKRILYVCNEFPLYYFKNNSVSAGPNFIDHILLHENFLKNLNSEVKNNVDIKPYVIDFGWNIVNRIKKIDKRFKVIKEKNIGNLYENYDLILPASPSTTLLESIYLNIPTITIFKQNIWQLNLKSKNIFNLLKKNNIYFDDSIKASNYINNNLDNLKRNWYSSENQKILDIFRKNFILKNPYAPSKISNIIEKNILKN